MTFRLYKGRTGWLLVPDFLLPPENACAPLEFLGYVGEGQLRPAELHGVKVDIRTKHFAVVPEALVRDIWPSFTPED